MLHFPNAKINLGLYVTGKRPDGYHDIETVFYPIRFLKDALEVIPAADGEETSIHISGKAIAGADTDNLVWKAYQLLQKDFPAKVNAVRIKLLKAIPMGAGLGGGSADGAFMLRLLDKYFELGLSDEMLATYALQLGSDCPFFIYNKPMIAKGRGEQLHALSLDLSDYSLQVVCPQIHVATATAFTNITPKPASFDLSRLAELPLASWKDQVQNDFEEPVFATHPELSRIKQQLYEGGAVYASLSGSGSALYGIFEKGRKADKVAGAEIFYFG